MEILNFHDCFNAILIISPTTNSAICDSFVKFCAYLTLTGLELALVLVVKLLHCTTVPSLSCSVEFTIQ